jgi:hypothetical protein
MGQPALGDGPLPAVFPDWSPYLELTSAARAYLRDPDLALEALEGVVPVGEVVTFTLERFVNETNCVWQEVAVCDGSRVVLWHGEDLEPGDRPAGTMTSSLRVLPLSQIAEVGTRKRLQRGADGSPAVTAIDVYVLLRSLDDGSPEPDERGGPAARQDSLRFVKTLEDGGSGQIARLDEFARTISALIGRPY